MMADFNDWLWSAVAKRERGVVGTKRSFVSMIVNVRLWTNRTLAALRRSTINETAVRSKRCAFRQTSKAFGELLQQPVTKVPHRAIWRPGFQVQ